MVFGQDCGNEPPNTVVPREPQQAPEDARRDAPPLKLVEGHEGNFGGIRADAVVPAHSDHLVATGEGCDERGTIDEVHVREAPGEFWIEFAKRGEEPAANRLG